MPATLDIQAKFVACYEDPRNEAGFDAGCYPAEQVVELAAPEGVAELKARFKAVYARRNACVRTMAGLKTSSAARARLIDQTLLLTEAIDHLEDVCAPLGLIAEPLMDDDLFTRELSFTHAPVHSRDGARGASSFSLYIPVPLDGLFTKEGGHAA